VGAFTAPSAIARRLVTISTNFLYFSISNSVFVCVFCFLLLSF